jgi:hypothetical protein
MSGVYVGKVMGQNASTKSKKARCVCVFKGITRLMAESARMWEVVRCAGGVQVKRLKREGWIWS